MQEIIGFILSAITLYTVPLIALLTVFASIIVCTVYKRKREDFVKTNSVALQNLKKINSNHSFYSIPNFNMVYSYDNRNYYSDISPKDYLIYELKFKKNDVMRAIKEAAVNKEKLKSYQDEVEASCQPGLFESTYSSLNTSKVDRILARYWLSKGIKKICTVEEALLHSTRHNPITDINITVRLNQVDMRGRTLDCKTATFCDTEIMALIDRLEQKVNGYYSDPNIWNALCRVERGKVSNRVRFAVYRRDGNRCRKCGSTHNLEVDHIYPVSKGGKSTFDNLQTLCHRCNTEKSNIIEPAANQKYRNNTGKQCPHCGIPLVKRQGSYGVFYGCPNYPKCRYTAK